jgi:hypothetical protein
LDKTSVDDGKPRTHTKPSKYKTKWSTSQAHSQIQSSLDHVKIRSDVGAKLSVALFNKETDVIRQQMAKAPELALSRSILLHSSPTPRGLFSDDARVTKAMEAADKHRPYAPKSSYNSGRGYKPWGAGAVTLTYAHQAPKT